MSLAAIRFLFADRCGARGWVTPIIPDNISCHITRRQTVFTEGIPAAAAGWSENLTVSPLNLTVAVGNVML